MKLGELYNQNEAKKRRILQIVVEIVPKRAKGVARAPSPADSDSSPLYQIAT